MSPKSAVEVRNLTFDLDGVDRYWHGQRKSVTAFFNNLSIFFPAGERFFIQSVKAHKDLIGDPQLAAEARTFYAQEAYHTREHVRYNAMLREQGYPIEAMDARVEELLSTVRRLIPPLWQLGVTCALEHFTALMADWLLATPRMLEGAHPTMAALWRWHAAEENEHKAVAFDVYKAAGGSYFVRCLIMAIATVIFWGKVLEHQVRLMHRQDPVVAQGVVRLG
jgi:predicted metal-dependent hydrolase